MTVSPSAIPAPAERAAAVDGLAAAEILVAAVLLGPGASLSLSDNPNVNALNDSCNRMYR